MTSIIRANAPPIALARTSAKLFNMLGITVLAMAAMVLTSSHARATDNLAPQDKSFLKNAAEAGNAEVSASQLALQKSSDPEVKSFAQKMIEDHTKVGDDLTKMATGKGVSVSADPSAADKAKILSISKLDGHGFDKQYAGVIGVSAHKDAVALFKKTAAGAKDPDIKQFAIANLPTLQHHLEMAKELKTSVDAKK